MYSDESSGTKFKSVCADFPNIALLTKSITPGDIQFTFVHAFVGNKSLGETVTDFSLVGSLESPTVVSINDKRAFDRADEKICLPVTEVILNSAVDNLLRSKNLRDWASLNAVVLPPLLTKAIALDGKTSVTELLKIFTAKISERGLEAATKILESNGKDKDKSIKDK